MQQRGCGAVKQPPERMLGAAAVFDSLCVAICHDLRGPVATAGAAIRSLSRHLATTTDDDAQLIDIARQSLAQADELLATLPRLIADAEKVRLTAVDLNELVEVVRDDVRFELRLGAGTLRVYGRLPLVLADRERLRIALRNLLRNAIRYRRTSTPLAIGLRAWRRGSRHTLTISDNGIGIPRTECRRVFAPLVRLGGSTLPGSGLGLTIARQAIEAMGGTIAVSSRPGLGTCFAVTLRSTASLP
jgi:signal transduction histidine kinase